MNTPNCECCGRFAKVEPGASWHMVYSGFPPEPDHDVVRCKSCTEKHGPSRCRGIGVRPEFSEGVYGAEPKPLRPHVCDGGWACHFHDERVVARMHELNEKFKGRERINDSGDLMPKLSEEP